MCKSEKKLVMERVVLKNKLARTTAAAVATKETDSIATWKI